MALRHRGDLLLIIATVFCGFALLFLLIGFATPNWLELDKNYITKGGFRKLGLWEACFNDYTHYKDFSGKLYKGCWWIFSEEYRPIWDYINPPWFLGIQIMMTIVLLIQIILVLAGILILIKCCPGRQSFMGLVILGAVAVISGILIAISVIIFGSKSVSDNNWIEMPEKNFVSWSFGCVVFSGFLVLFGGVSMIVAGLYARLMNQYDKRSTDYIPEANEYQLKEKHENHRLPLQSHQDNYRHSSENEQENHRHQSRSNRESQRSQDHYNDQNHRSRSRNDHGNHQSQSRNGHENHRSQSNYDQESHRSRSDYKDKTHRSQSNYDQESHRSQSDNNDRNHRSQSRYDQENHRNPSRRNQENYNSRNMRR